MRCLRYLFLIIGTVGWLSNAWAGVEPPIEATIPGTAFFPPVATPSPLESNIPGYSSTNFDPAWTDGFTLVEVTNLVKLFSDQNTTTYIDFAYQLTVPVQITYYESNSPEGLSITSETLRIDYSPEAGTEYRQMDVFRFFGGCEVSINLDAANITLTDADGEPLSEEQSARVSETVFLQSAIIVERYFDFDPNTQLCTADFDCTDFNSNNANELIVCWNPIPGSEEYDLEWIFIENYDGEGGAVSPSDLFYDFNRNAARVQISGTSYAIPLVYEQGYLLYRVRGIGRNPQDFSKPVFGRWSCGTSGCPEDCDDSSGTVDSYSNQELLDPHESDRKNWQAITTYAEEGKRKDVVSYLDGANRNRQTVTGLSTDRMTLVGETIYDFQGRPALQILPALVNDASLRFYNNFNQNLAGEPYSRRDFDTTAVDCQAPAGPMLSTFKGASNYYSPDNPDLSGFHAYIPDAKGFPFSRLEYTPDNTGRITRQGGVGDRHQLDSGHETKIFYGTPNQYELDRLFGNEVGNSLHYKKNMTIDPNGQISLAYLDAKGNTIATALAGNPPQNVEALESYTQEELELDLLENNVKDEEEYALTSHNTLLVNTNSLYEFHYTMDGLKYRDETCMADNVCYDCVYDLEIKVIDNLNCGDTLYHHTETIGKLFVPKINPMTGNPVMDGRRPVMVLNTFCLPPSGPILDDEEIEPEYGSADLPFQVLLEVGSYTVIKTLKVNEAAADAYVDHFLNDPSNSCPDIFDDLLAAELAQIDTSACHLECEDMAELCVPAVTHCTNIRQAMLADVSPFGQYGFFPLDGIEPEHPFDQLLSVFSEENILPNDPNSNFWELDPNLLVDEFGEPVVVDLNGEPVAINHPDVPLEIILNEWREEWAEHLLPFHPEYCYLGFCGQYLEESEAYDAALLETNTFEEAITSGYLEINNTNDPIQDEDPFFGISFPPDLLPEILFPEAPGQLMSNKIEVYVSEGNSQLSMKEVAIALANCPNDPLSCYSLDWGTNEETRDQEWQIYRTLYLTYKEELLYLIRTEYAIVNGCYNECIGADPFQIQRNNFWAPFDEDAFDPHPGFPGDPFDADNDHYCNQSTYFYYKHKTKRFPSVYDILPEDFNLNFFDDDPQEVVEELYDESGELTAECCIDSIRLRDMPSVIKEMYNFYLESDNPSPTAGLIELDIPEGIRNIIYKPSNAFLEIKHSNSEESDNYEIKIGDSSCKIFFENPFENDEQSIPIISTCCFELIDDPTIWPAEEDNFTFVATFENGMSIELEGSFGRSCWFKCPPFPLHCPPTGETKELLTLWNNLLTENTFTGALNTVNEDLIGSYLQEYFPEGNIENYTWTGAQSGSQFNGVLSDGNDNCSFQIQTPANFDWDQALYFLSIEADQNQLDENNHTKHFIAQVQLADGTVAEVTGQASCFEISYCCTAPANEPQSDVGDVGRVRGFKKVCQWFKKVFGQKQEEPVEPQPGGDIALRQGEYTRDCDNCEVITLTGGILDDTYTPDCPEGCDPPEVITQDLANTCVQQQIDMATYNAELQYQAYLEELAVSIKEAYMKKCLEAAETFSVRYYDSRHHFTLYYYDQANNLVKTVPPEGVRPLTDAQVQQVQDYRNGGANTPVYPDHNLESTYTFNSLNQLTRQRIPDHQDATLFFYDPLGRLVASLNPKQKVQGRKFTYTFYDELSRIIETGEVRFPELEANNTSFPAFLNLIQNYADNPSQWANWINARDQSQVTRTYYDEPMNADVPALFPNNEQENLRSRIATLTHQLQENQPPVSATHYSYDIHGSVKTLVQAPVSLSPKVIEYDYDLVSGNVNALYYQRDQPDQFTHRYAYDADNRLLQVETSPDAVIWDTEARYAYYPHGPLARVELGEDDIQGLDYAYTIHGWIKGMNSGSLQAQHDMGKDGLADSPHARFAPDAVGYLLAYYEDQSGDIFDYRPIGAGASFVPGSANSFFGDVGRPLYNGNIRRMTIAIRPFMEEGIPMGNLYFYDQLNRIRTMSGYLSHFDPTENKWLNGLPAKKYESRYEYDANGNLTALQRRANNGLMDRFTYHYENGNNQLTHVDDTVAPDAYEVDIDDQAPGNYKYDALGNLEIDASEGLAYEWTLQNKPSRITKSPNETFRFFYDALGNRISKSDNNRATIYIPDASGNVLATYRMEGGIFLESAYLYGSKRLGEFRADKCLQGPCPEADPPPPANHFYRHRGQRHYELSNHLGNVLATVTDRKLPVEDGNGLVSSYEADIHTAQDYFPFGMLMPGRNLESGEFRYGFQGQEEDDEIKGRGNSTNYKFRMDDHRLSRFFSIDPSTIAYPHYSPYQFSGNQVINAVELEGLEQFKLFNDITVYGPYSNQTVDKTNNYILFNYSYIANQNQGKTRVDNVNVSHHTLNINSQISQIQRYLHFRIYQIEDPKIEYYEEKGLTKVFSSDFDEFLGSDEHLSNLVNNNNSLAQAQKNREIEIAWDQARYWTAREQQRIISISQNSFITGLEVMAGAEYSTAMTSFYILRDFAKHGENTDLIDVSIKGGGMIFKIPPILSVGTPALGDYTYKDFTYGRSISTPLNGTKPWDKTFGEILFNSSKKITKSQIGKED